MQLNQLSADKYSTTGVSNRYRVIDTEQLVTQICSDIGLNASSETIYPRISTRGKKQTTKHAVVLTLGSTVMLAGTPVFPRIYVRNSYSGESALTVSVGFFRLVCSNGMMVGTSHFNGRILHLQSGINQLPQLRKSIVQAVEWCRVELPKLAARLDATVLSPNQISTVLASVSASKRLAEAVSTRVQLPMHMLRPEDRRPDGQLTAWNVWNIVNEQARVRSRSQLRQLDVNAGLLDAIEAVVQQAA